MIYKQFGIFYGIGHNKAHRYRSTINATSNWAERIGLLSGVPLRFSNRSLKPLGPRFKVILQHYKRMNMNSFFNGKYWDY